MTRRHRDAAYHEAGHAVVGRMLGRRLRSMSIAGTDASHGDTMFWSLDWERASGRVLRREVLISYAGPLAEERYTGSWNAAGAAGDMDAVAECLLRLNEDGDAYAAQARALVDEHWPAIERVAEAIMVAPGLTLRPGEVEALRTTSRTTQRVPRGGTRAHRKAPI